MLEFTEVSKSFWTGRRHKVILDRASFRVEKGNSLGILAPNGAGKTTIVNMIAGLEKPDEGEIRRECRISFPLGFMGGVVSRLSARDNARFIAKLYGLDSDYVEAFCRWVCGLEEYFDMPVGTYSSGMRGRFSLALLLALEFDLYLIAKALDRHGRLRGLRWNVFGRSESNSRPHSGQRGSVNPSRAYEQLRQYIVGRLMISSWVVISRPRIPGSAVR